MQIGNIPLTHTNMWVQINNLPMGLMKETVGVKLANYIGSFVEYDKNNGSRFWRQYMRIRVQIDVRKPLKKDTKEMNREGQWCTVNFKYEKLGIFFFVCGIMGHAENKCEVRFAMEQDDGRRDWSSDIRVDPRRQGGRMASRWLREERGIGVEHGSGVTAAQGQPMASQNSAGPSVAADVSQHHHRMSATQSSLSQPAIMTRQNLSLANYDMRTSSLKLTDSNNFFPSNPVTNDLTAQPNALNSITDFTPTFTVADNLNIPFPNINDLLACNNNRPIIVNTDGNASPSLPHNTLTFNSQPIKKFQINTTHTRPNPLPTFQPYIPDPTHYPYPPQYLSKHDPTKNQK
jgi:hypothetical protein